MKVKRIPMCHPGTSQLSKKILVSTFCNVPLTQSLTGSVTSSSSTAAPVQNKSMSSNKTDI